MIVGHHLIWTVYGSWLPNDPRGSSSHEIRAAKIADLGEVHFGRKRVQPASRDIRSFYAAAHPRLKHDFLTLGSNEIAAVGRAFAEVIQRKPYTCYACAILPDHVHLLIRRHRDLPERMIAALQEASCEAILQLGERPASHPVWGGPGWKVFLDSAADMRRVDAYIKRNPELPQQWEFVQVYDGWLPGTFGLRQPAKTQARRRTE